MKFFKCLSQNVSILQDQESAMKRLSKLSFKNKKKRSCSNEKGTPIPLPRRRLGLTVRFAIDENNQPRSDETPLFEDTKSGVDNPVDPAYQGIHNTSWGSDFESYLPEYCVHVDDNLNKSYTVHDSLCQLSVEEPDQTDFEVEKYLAHKAACNEVSLLNCKLPVEEPDQTEFNMEEHLASMADCNKVSNSKLPIEEPDQTEFKIEKYLSSMPYCNEVSLLNCESDESIVSFGTINATGISHFIDCSLTPSNRSLPERATTDRPRFLERFPEDILDNGSIFHQSYSDDMSQQSINDNPSDLPEIRRLADLCDESQPLIAKGSPNGSQTSGGMDIDVEGLHETATSIGSGHLDPVVTCPNRLFKAAYDSQVVDERSPARRRRIVVTMVRSESGGFGLTLSDECPPQIVFVEKGSPADCAGIKAHDMVVKINGQRMHSSTPEMADHLLRTKDEPYVLLELQRPSQEFLDKADMRRRLARTGFPKTDTEDGTDDATTTRDVDVDSTYQQNLSAEAACAFKASQEYEMTCQSSDAIADGLKHKATRHLMSLEADYTNFMHYGIEKFSRPLRHCILSSQQHRTLFQNIEKLVTISEYHVNQMRDENASINQGLDDSQCSTHSLFEYLPALVYESKIHMLVQAYETYAQGFEQAFSLMKDVRKSMEFSAFLEEVKKDGSDNSSISAFLKKPILHIQKLYKIFKKVHAATSPQSPDYQSLQMIKDQLSKCARIVVKLCCARQDATSSQNNLDCQSVKSDKSRMSSTVNIRPSESVKSLNIIRVQDKIVFARNLQDDQLSLDKQHLIYQGNVYKSNKKGSWVKHELLLFSELLLLAKETSEGSLCVSERPIHINYLTGLNISRAHPSEFILHLLSTAAAATEKVSRKQKSLHPSEESGSSMILRAASAQDKYVWKSLLEQRVPAVTGCSLNYIVPSSLI